MSSIVVVKKAGKAVIAADSLTTFGRTKFGKKYQRNPEKIHKFESSYIGLVGDAAHSNVFENIIDTFAKELRFDSRKHIFETYLKLHQILKDKFHLNPDAAEDVAYQSSQIDALIANENGIFGLFIAGWVCYQVIEAHHTAKARRDGTPLPNPFGLNDLSERLGFGKAWPSAGTTASHDSGPDNRPTK